MSSIEFKEWLEENYEVEADMNIVTQVFLNRPLTVAQLSDLNPDATPAALKNAVALTGYPLE